MAKSGNMFNMDFSIVLIIIEIYMHCIYNKITYLFYFNSEKRVASKTKLAVYYRALICIPSENKVLLYLHSVVDVQIHLK